jgi:hypothetical protein
MPDPAPCERCGQVHLTRYGKPACPGHITNGPRKGQPCTRGLGAETEHKGIGQCIKHGGNTTNAKKHAAKVQVEQRMTQAVAVVEARAFGIGRPREAVDPFEEIAVSLWRRKVALVWIEAELAPLRAEELVWIKAQEETGEEQATETGTGTGWQGGDTLTERTTRDARIRRQARLHVLVELWQDVQRDHDRLCLDAIKLGMAERELRVTELLGGQMYEVIRAILADPDLGVTATAEMQATVAQRHLELVRPVA